MPVRPTLALLAGVALACALPAPARAQLELPDSFTNLKVLPKNISREQLLSTMRGFTGALGVHCDYCHAEKAGAGATPGAAEGAGARATGADARRGGAGGSGAAGAPAGRAGAPQPGTAPAGRTALAAAPPGARPGGPPRLDFPSDKKDQKRIARSMIRMVQAINASYLAKIAELDTPRVQVGCITCHHGVSEPRTLADVLYEEASEKGVASAVRRYDDLKTHYYGSGAYDFREESLDELATRLTGANRPDDALAVLDLAGREFPQSGTVPFLQAEALLKKGDKPGAIAKLQRALELQPRNEFVRRRLAEVQASP